MDEKIKTRPPRFPAKETLIWRRHCSIGQSCCSMTSKQFLESSSGMKFVYPRVRLANQNPGAFVSVSYTNQIALFPFVCCFCFVRAFSFQGQTKIALYLHEKRLLVLPSDSNSRTTSSTRYNWKFFRVFSKNRHPGKLLSLISLLSLLKEVKPSPDRKMIKLLITSTLKSLAIRAI